MPTPTPDPTPTPTPDPKPAPEPKPVPAPTTTTVPVTDVLPEILKDLPKATGWGDLTVTFRFDGTPPVPATIVADKDPAFCGKFPLVNESLVVNSGNRGIKNVIAYVYLSAAGGKMPIHESYFSQLQETVSMDNANCRFEPHVSMLWGPQTLEVGNSDEVGHNMNFAMLGNNPLNFLLPPKSKSTVTSLTKVERMPASVSCNIHPWMKGILLVRDNPYFATSDENGVLTIKNLPAGEWPMQFWQEQAGYVREGKQDGASIAWKSGRTTVVIEDGKATDLGTIDLPAKMFAD